METLRDRPWHRHDLVWVNTAHCAIAGDGTDVADAREVMDAAIATVADNAADRTLIAAWIDARRPFVVRCQDLDCKARGVLAVGLPLPLEFEQNRQYATPALNRLLQEIAWNAVVQNPLSGVSA